MNKPCSEETKQKLRLALSGEKNPMYGKHHTPESSTKMSLARIGNKNALGHRLSEESKAKISKANKGKPCGKRGAGHYLFGKHMSPEHLARREASRKASYRKENHPLYGKHLSVEARAKISMANKGEKNSFYGKYHTEETKRKMSEARKGKYTGENSFMYGKHPSAETRRKMSLAQKGRNVPWQTKSVKVPKVREIVRMEEESEAEFGKRLKLSRLMKGKPSFFKGKHFSKETLDKLSRASKSRWANPEYRERVVRSVIAASNHRPTSAEIMLKAILDEVCPNEYKYVGNSNEAVIGGCSPDFIHTNGCKRVIEAHGDFWHSFRRTGRTKEEEEKYKIDRYKEFGYDCLILWESEIKKHKDIVTEKVLAFNKS